MMNFANVFNLTEEAREYFFYVWSGLKVRPRWNELGDALSRIEGWQGEQKSRHMEYKYLPNGVKEVGIPNDSKKSRDRVGSPVITKIQQLMGLGKDQLNEVLTRALNGEMISKEEIYELGGIANVEVPQETTPSEEAQENWQDQEWYKEYLKTLEEQQKKVAISNNLIKLYSYKKETWIIKYKGEEHIVEGDVLNDENVILYFDINGDSYPEEIIWRKYKLLEGKTTPTYDHLFYNGKTVKDMEVLGPTDETRKERLTRIDDKNKRDNFAYPTTPEMEEVLKDREDFPEPYDFPKPKWGK